MKDALGKQINEDDTLLYAQNHHGAVRLRLVKVKGLEDFVSSAYIGGVAIRVKPLDGGPGFVVRHADRCVKVW